MPGDPLARPDRAVGVHPQPASSVDPPCAEVGVGIKPFRDPELAEDSDAPRLLIDVTRRHNLAVRWDACEAVFTVDAEVVRVCPGPPMYPLQLVCWRCSRVLLSRVGALVGIGPALRGLIGALSRAGGMSGGKGGGRLPSSSPTGHNVGHKRRRL